MQSTHTTHQRLLMTSLLATATVCFGVGCDVEPADELGTVYETPGDIAQPEAPAATPYELVEEDGMLIATGDDFRVRIHRSRRVAELNVGREQLSDWYTRPFSRWANEATDRLYDVFEDDFDFIVFVPATEGQHPAMLTDGESVRVSNAVEGLGLPVFDNTAMFGSDGRLQSTIMLGGIKHIVSGPSLRELGERWANGFVPSTSLDHFGFSDVGGVLGGCSPDQITPLGHDHYQCDFNGTYDWSPDGTIHNDRIYARLELYLMGLVGPEGIPSVSWADDAVWVDPDFGIFEGQLRTATVDELRATHGKRVPAHTESQREFRTLFVVVSGGEFIDAPLFHSLDARVAEFAAPKPVLGEPGMYNFYEAASGLATLDAEQLDASLR